MTNDERVEEIEWALAETNYKYFGDYEFSDDQRKAVEILENAAKDFVKLISTDSEHPGLTDLNK